MILRKVACMSDTVKVYVDSVIKVRESELPLEVTQRLIKLLTHNNPRYYQQINIGLKAFNVPRNIRSYLKTDNHFVLPRGTGRMLREVAAEKGMKVEIVDNRVTSEPIDMEPAPDFELRDYQEEAVTALSSVEQGIFEGLVDAVRLLLL